MRNITVDFITQKTAKYVADITKTIYLERFKKLDTLSAEKQWLEHKNKNNIIALASYEQKPVGFISLKKSNDNPKVYELGMLSVIKEFRDGKAAAKLTRFAKESFSKIVDYNAIYLENVTSHYYTQRKAFLNGGVESAISLFAMPELDNIDCRLSFVISFFENKNSIIEPIYIPKDYANIILFFYKGLKKRSIFSTSEKQPIENKSVFTKREYPTINAIKTTFFSIGRDFTNQIDYLDTLFIQNDYIKHDIILPLSSEYINYAVTILKNKGYFIGGVLPFWLGSDALLMQKTKNYNWDNIKIYSHKAKIMLDLIKKDYLNTL